MNSPDALPKSADLIAALIDLFHLIPLAGEKYVKVLLTLVFRVEQSLISEQTSAYRLPLLRFLVRYPEETFRQLLNGFPRPHDSHAHRLILVSTPSPLTPGVTIKPCSRRFFPLKAFD